VSSISDGTAVLLASLFRALIGINLTFLGRRPEFIRLARSCMKYRLILEFGQVRRGSHLDTTDLSP
jgi:hypothetical protein